MLSRYVCVCRAKKKEEEEINRNENERARQNKLAFPRYFVCGAAANCRVKCSCCCFRLRNDDETLEKTTL